MTLEAHGFVADTNFTVSSGKPSGEKITIGTTGVYLSAINLDTTNLTATTARIRTTLLGADVATASIISGVATFSSSVFLSASTVYFLLYDIDGSTSYNGRYRGAGDHPHAGTVCEWTQGVIEESERGEYNSITGFVYTLASETSDLVCNVKSIITIKPAEYYFSDVGTQLGSWIDNGWFNGEPIGSPYEWITSGTQYNYGYGTQGYQFEDNTPWATSWKQNFSGTFPSRGVAEFSVATDSGSAGNLIVNPAGYSVSGNLSMPFGPKFTTAGSIQEWGASDTYIGSYYSSGTYVRFKYVYDFDARKFDVYKDGVKVLDQQTILGTLEAKDVNAVNVYVHTAAWQGKFQLDDFLIYGTVSNKLLNAAIHVTTQNDLVCNARIYVEKEGTDYIIINGTNYTSYWDSFNIIKKLSQASSFTCKLSAIEASDKLNVKEGSEILFYSENTDDLIFKGKITNVIYKTGYDCEISGNGMEVLLFNRNVYPRNTENKSYFNNVDSDTIVTSLCSINDDGASPFILTVGQNDSYPNISIRFDEGEKLSALSAISENTGLDWWISHPVDTQNNFNIGLKSTTPLMTFYTGGVNQNCWRVNYEKDIGHLANYVVGLGYGDGINQLSTTFYDASATSTTISGTTIPAYASDANTNFLYHFENNGTDSGPSGMDLGVSGAVTYISSGNKIGSYSVGEMATGSCFVYTGSPYDGWLWDMPSGTFEGWVYPSGTKGVMAKTDTPSIYVFDAVVLGGGKAFFGFRRSSPGYSTDVFAYSTNDVPANEWSHLAVSWNVENNEARIYLNGELDSVHSGSFYISDASTINQRQIGPFSGYLDEMRLSSNIKTSFNGGGPFITATQDYIPVSGTTGFSNTGSLNIGNELIYYTSTGTNSFEGCTRGANSTTATTHPIKCLTYKYVDSETFWANHLLSESGSSVYTNELKTKKLENKEINSINGLQTYTSNYLTTHKDGIIRMTIDVGDVRTVYSTVTIGDWVTVTDTDTDLNTDFKIVGMEISNDPSEGEKLYLELSNRRSVLLESLMDNKKDITAEGTYAQGSTNVFQIGPFSDNAVGGTTGFENPLYLRFYIPSDAKNISENNIIKLNWIQSNFESTVSGTTPSIYSYATDNVPVSIKVDGTDRTTALGGPWSGTQVSDLNIASYITLGGYHTVQLSPSGTSPRKMTVDGWAQVYIK